jgi:hypothetical protein
MARAHSGPDPERITTLKNIIIIVTFILFVALVAQAWAVKDVSKLEGKKSDPGVDRDYTMRIINPVDANGQPVNMEFDWKGSPVPFRRVK